MVYPFCWQFSQNLTGISSKLSHGSALNLPHRTQPMIAALISPEKQLKTSQSSQTTFLARGARAAQMESGLNTFIFIYSLKLP